ncbi:hypothetical protein Tco_0393239, partial [Tanacetum coccineum]
MSNDFNTTRVAQQKHGSGEILLAVIKRCGLGSKQTCEM